MKRALCWLGLLIKRLWKRPGYLLIVLAVPLLTLALSLVSAGDRGLVNVTLCRTEESDAAAEALCERLVSRPGVLRITLSENEQAALRSLRAGETDAVWIIGALGEDLSDFARRGWAEGPIRIVEREDTVLLVLARETLYASLFTTLSYELYASLMEERWGETDAQTLRDYYDSGVDFSSLLRLETLSGAAPVENHLVAPLRGLLSLLVLLGALSSGLYAIADARRETFLWLREPLRSLVPPLSHFLAALPVGLAALLALSIAGVSRGFGTELGTMLVYCVLCAVFTELLRRALRREEGFAAAIPAVLLLSLALTPVFAEIRVLQPVKWLLPGWWYLRRML